MNTASSMIFVTGGTGLLGSHLLVELSKGKNPIRALYRSDSRIKQTKKIFDYYFKSESDDYFHLIEWVQGDILDITDLLDIIQGGDEVYHCAALVSFHPSDFHLLMKINREGTANVVNACIEKNVKKLCYVSSTAAVGSGPDVIDESTKWKKTPTTSAYSISKYSAEKEVWRGIEEGLEAVIVNPCIILGPGNWNEGSLAILKNVTKGISFYPTGSNSQVDARDVAEIMIQLMRSEISAERYLCIGTNQSILDLMTAIANELRIKPPHRRAPKWLANMGRVLISFLYIFSKNKPSVTKENVRSMYSQRKYSADKISKALNFKFRPLADTIQNAIQGKISD